MADQHLALALNFINDQPLLAARVLERCETEQAAVFVQALQVDYRTLIINHMAPLRTADVCKLLGADKAAQILSKAEADVIVRVLRLVPQELCNAILRGLRKKTRETCSLLLHYSRRSVGAWMNPHIPQLSVESTVGETLAYIRKSDDLNVSANVYMVNDQGVLQGKVSYLELIQAGVKQPVSQLLSRDIATVSVHMLVEQAVSLSEWDNADVLAVIDKNRLLLGMLRHADLRRALRENDNQNQVAAQGSDPLTGILDVYGQSLLVLFNTFTNVIEADKKS